jgi:hypothetical protein
VVVEEAIAERRNAAAAEAARADAHPMGVPRTSVTAFSVTSDDGDDLKDVGLESRAPLRFDVGLSDAVAADLFLPIFSVWLPEHEAQAFATKHSERLAADVLNALNGPMDGENVSAFTGRLRLADNFRFAMHPFGSVARYSLTLGSH